MAKKKSTRKKRPNKVRLERWMAIYDTHGDMAHYPGLRAALEFSKHFKPQVRIAGGDHFDLRPMRSGATQEEKAESLNDDVLAGIEFLTEWKPSHFLWGNHDDRIIEWQDSADGFKREMAYRLHDDVCRALPKSCLQYPYDKRQGILRYGNFHFIHGYHSGINALKQATETYGNVIMGHIHAPGVFRNKDIHASIGFSSGCMCRLDMKYNKRQVTTLRQAHGFLYGFKYPSGKLSVVQAYPIDDYWIFPTEHWSLSNQPQ